MAREGKKIFISVDLIKTGVNRWGRWNEVQQETAHLSGFPHFSLPIRLSQSLISVLLSKINSWSQEYPKLKLPQWQLDR